MRSSFYRSLLPSCASEIPPLFVISCPPVMPYIGSFDWSPVYSFKCGIYWAESVVKTSVASCTLKKKHQTGFILVTNSSGGYEVSWKMPRLHQWLHGHGIPKHLLHYFFFYVLTNIDSTFWKYISQGFFYCSSFYYFECCPVWLY